MNRLGKDGRQINMSGRLMLRHGTFTVRHDKGTPRRFRRLWIRGPTGRPLGSGQRLEEFVSPSFEEARTAWVMLPAANKTITEKYKA